MARSVEISGGGILAPLLIKVISEALVPKEAQKQQQRQMALATLAHFMPAMSKWKPEQQQQFYSDILFPAFGMYQPTSLIKRAFGAKPESVLPLPKGAINLEPGVKTKTPTGKMITEAPGLRMPPTQPFTFPRAVTPLIEPENIAELEERAKQMFDDPAQRKEWVDEQTQKIMTGAGPTEKEKIGRAAGMLEKGRGKFPSELTERELMERLLPPNLRTLYEEHLSDRERKALESQQWMESTEALRQQRLAPKPWQPMTEEEYGKYHRPPAWGPSSKEEYKEVHPTAERESLAEKRATKKESQRISALREEIRTEESKTARSYSRFLDILKRQMAAHNKSGAEPIEDLTELPSYMSETDWLIEHPEGKQHNQKLNKLRDELYKLETGEERPLERQVPTRMKVPSINEMLFPKPSMSPIPFQPSAAPKVRGSTKKNPSEMSDEELLKELSK
jgi:hypothetical protein